MNPDNTPQLLAMPSVELANLYLQKREALSDEERAAILAVLKDATANGCFVVKAEGAPNAYADTTLAQLYRQYGLDDGGSAVEEPPKRTSKDLLSELASIASAQLRAKNPDEYNALARAFNSVDKLYREARQRESDE